MSSPQARTTGSLGWEDSKCVICGLAASIFKSGSYYCWKDYKEIFGRDA